MSVKSRELREQRKKLCEDAQKLIPTDHSAMTDEIRTNFDKMMADADRLKGDIDRLERGEVLEIELRGTTAPPEAQPGTDATAIEKRKKEQDDAHKRAFLRYLRMGEGRLGDEDRKVLESRGRFQVGQGQQAELRDMGVSVGDLGGYFVPQGFVYDVEVALKYYGDMLNVAKIMDTATGNALPYPTTNDTGVMGEIIGEGTQVSTADVSVGQLMLGAEMFSTKLVKASLQLLQDSAFDIEAFLKDRFAERLGRILNNKFTVGIGTGATPVEPMGVLTATVANCGSPAVGGGAYGIPVIAVGSSASTGGSETGGTSYGWQDLVALEHSVDPLYRRTARYMMNDQTLRYGKQILDKYGRPLWKAGVAASDPDTLNGYPYSINNDMPVIALNAKTILFGRFDKYLVRRVRELAVVTLRERFIDYAQIGYIGFARYDGQLLDAGTHPINYLVQASS